MIVSRLVIDCEKYIQNTYHKLLGEVAKLGDVSIKEDGDSLVIKNGNGTVFMTLTPKREALDINVITLQEINSDRINTVEQGAYDKTSNIVTVETVDDIDKELWDWVVQAYNEG